MEKIPVPNLIIPDMKSIMELLRVMDKITKMQNKVFAEMDRARHKFIKDSKNSKYG